MGKLPVNNLGQRYLNVGAYNVVEEKKSMVCIYLDGESKLVTSKPNWNQATQVAKLLNEAYRVGYNDGRYPEYKEY